MCNSEIESHCKKIRDEYNTRKNLPEARVDAILQADIWLAFWQAADVKAIDIDDIEVIVKQCEVWLSGTVDDTQAQQLAECLVKGIKGVNRCHNELLVKHVEP